MTVKMVVRMFAYALYVTLWLPAIAVAFIVTPFVWLRVFGKAGFTCGEAINAWWKALMNGIRHDVHYIRTGEW